MAIFETSFHKRQRELSNYNGFDLSEDFLNEHYSKTINKAVADIDDSPYRRAYRDGARGAIKMLSKFKNATFMYSKDGKVKSVDMKTLIKFLSKT